MQASISFVVSSWLRGEWRSLQSVTIKEEELKITLTLRRLREHGSEYRMLDGGMVEHELG
jgi:hypothetical protein